MIFFLAALKFLNYNDYNPITIAVISSEILAHVWIRLLIQTNYNERRASYYIPFLFNLVYIQYYIIIIMSKAVNYCSVIKRETKNLRSKLSC